MTALSVYSLFPCPKVLLNIDVDGNSFFFFFPPEIYLTQKSDFLFNLRCSLVSKQAIFYSKHNIAPQRSIIYGYMSKLNGAVGKMASGHKRTDLASINGPQLTDSISRQSIRSAHEQLTVFIQHQTITMFIPISNDQSYLKTFLLIQDNNKHFSEVEFICNTALLY